MFNLIKDIFMAKRHDLFLTYFNIVFILRMETLQRIWWRTLNCVDLSRQAVLLATSTLKTIL